MREILFSNMKRNLIMNLNKKIGFLLDTGFTPKFVSSLNENKINLLFEKMTKEENKEAQEITTKIKRFSASEVADAKTKGESLPGGKAVKMNPDGSVDVTMEGKELEEDDTLNVVNDPDATADGMGIFEKFESKAQQGLFWARCNKCKTDDCKWCKMAKEFSKSTSKKQYKTMPEKKHPEKTVKYNKKETKENFTFKDYLGKLGSAYTSEMAKKVKGTTPTFSESIFEKNLENIIQENLKPTMKKRDLLRLIEASMGDTKEKETETETEKEEKKKTGNPFKRPKTKDDPEASDTKEKETETETEKEEKKKTGNPFKRPKTKDNPEARRMKKESFTQQDFMKQVKNSGLI